ncbi:MAG: TIGR01459 family HAD-type hydrolase [Marivibrio sp.]|uniref:TIGR01459 family HAD-type hydrolase n=1 Tax=Marivibrio sp. TaxID=2039719 RepID=UPI0032F070E8
MSIEVIKGLGEIAERYGLFVIDQWGVLHNGVEAHPGAIDAMERLRALSTRTGAKIALLSNSGKRVQESHKRLAAMGFPRALYDTVVTSGEEVHRGLLQRGRADADDPFYRDLGPNFVGFWWDDDRGILEGCDVREVETVETADFLLCSGTDDAHLDAYRPALEAALARDLPMTCANPDRVSVQPDGTLKMCPGEVAAAYEAMGGRVRWHGKPRPEVYQRIRDALRTDAPGLGIGDSLQHDIQGARDSGLDSLFIAGGIHKDDLPSPLSAEAVQRLAEARGVAPSYAATDFRW